MLWRVHPGTVNPVPRGKHSRFDSVDLHHAFRSDYVKSAFETRQSSGGSSRQTDTVRTGSHDLV